MHDDLSPYFFATKLDIKVVLVLFLYVGHHFRA